MLAYVRCCVDVPATLWCRAFDGEIISYIGRRTLFDAEGKLLDVLFFTFVCHFANCLCCSCTSLKSMSSERAISFRFVLVFRPPWNFGKR